jgi:hypothetical protein
MAWLKASFAPATSPGPPADSEASRGQRRRVGVPGADGLLVGVLRARHIALNFQHL